STPATPEGRCSAWRARPDGDVRADAARPGARPREPRRGGDALAAAHPSPRRPLRARLAGRRVRAPEPHRLLVLHALRHGPGRARVDVLRGPGPLRALAPPGRAPGAPPGSGQHDGVLPPDLERAPDRGRPGAVGAAGGRPAPGAPPAVPDGRTHPTELPDARGAGSRAR